MCIKDIIYQVTLQFVDAIEVNETTHIKPLCCIKPGHIFITGRPPSVSLPYRTASRILLHFSDLSPT